MESKKQSSTDTSRLVEVEMEGSEPFRRWPVSDYESVLKEGMALLANAQNRLDEIFDKVDSLEEYAVSLLQKMIQTKSVNGSEEGEKPLAEIIAKELHSLGFEVKTIEPEAGRTSLVGRKTFRDPLPTLIFYGHLDTVPAGDLSKWKHPPFGGIVEDGKIFGRGAQDCKMGLASAIVAAKVFNEFPALFSCTLCVAAAADEEAGGHKGIHKLIENGLLRGDYAVYIESIPGEIHLAHNGMVWLKVTTKGESAHSSKKKTFTNAILKMGKVAEALDKMEFTGWKPHAMVPGGPYLSVNKIEGGSKENMIPDECSIICDIRTMPGQTLDSVLADVNKTFEMLRQTDPELEVESNVLTYARSGELPPTEPIAVFTQLAAERVIGVRPKITGVAALTDQRWAVLDAGISMIIYSCGTPTWHIPDEYVVIKDYLNTVKILCLLGLMLSGRKKGR